MSAEASSQASGNPVLDHLDLWSSVAVKKAAAGRGSNGNITPYGIQKLRELILELAVRGRLVPQDPNEESASVLLEQVAIEKNGLIKAGKVKSFKKLADLSDGEITHSLPSSWQWVRFGDVAQHNAGKTLDRGRNSGMPRDYITTSNLYWGFFDLTEVREMLIREDELEKCTATKGDLLVCEGGEAGRAAVWDYDKDICFQNHIHRARLFAAISPYYVYRVFENLSATGEINKYRKGVGISNMSGKALASIPVPLPPLAEQRRIVAKVDELMALCDQLEQQQTDSLQAHQTLVETLLRTLVDAGGAESTQEAWNRIAEHFDTLFTTEKSIDQLKQAILQLAVMGKLVSQDPDDEPASVLFEKIASERSSLIRSGALKMQKLSPDVSEGEKLFNLPEAWKWVRFGSLIKSFTNGLYKKSSFYGDKGVISLRMYNIQDGSIDFADARRVNVSENELNQYRLEEGDLLINRVNSKELVGKTAIIPKFSEPLLFESMNMRAKPFTSHVSSEYLNLFMKTGMTKEILLSHAKEAISQASLNQGQISSLPVPLPPKAEQQRIVAKVDELMAICDTLKTRIEEAQATQVHLADAVVEQAVA